MKVILNSVDGISDAIEAMFFSKRSWNIDKHNEIRKTCDIVLDKHGFLNNGLLRTEENELYYQQFNNWLNMVCKMAVHHITIGKFIDLSFIVEGLHRAGQDDWDSHAKRFDNRIIRSSTRLATYDNEKSDYYKDKILTTDEALNVLEIKAPDCVFYNNKKYVKTTNGYILEEYKDNKDVKRGLYMLSIPCNFIFRINLTEFAHVYKERGEHGAANPEVKECAEQCLALITSAHNQFNKDLMLAIKN